MANKKGPPEYTRFKKGQSGNPSGRPKVAKELASISTYTDAELRKVISKYLRMIKAALIEAGNSEALPIIEIIIARTLVQAGNKGDFTRIMPLIERVAGKVLPVDPAAGAIHKLTIERISGEKVELTSKVETEVGEVAK